MNIAVNFTRPAYAGVMARKVWSRVFDRADVKTLDANRSWCEDAAKEFEPVAQELDNGLWLETLQFCEEFQERARRILAGVDVDLGGGGHYPMLYFLARRLRPDVVVETGVAAGFSSQALLTALEANGRGRLYSSDFPYFRVRDAESYVGILVDPAFKSRWDLHLHGDRRNLPRILADVSGVDLFHYDSDKTTSGRAFAMSAIDRVLRPGGVIVMDDIQDTPFFRDYVTRETRPWKVFSFEGKYVGVIGL